MGDHWLFWLLTAYMVNQASLNLVRPMVSYRALSGGVLGVTGLFVAISLAGVFRGLQPARFRPQDPAK